MNAPVLICIAAALGLGTATQKCGLADLIASSILFFARYKMNDESTHKNM